MDKQVFCLIPPRKKVIKFKSRPAACSDLSTVKQILLNMCEKDDALNQTLRNQIMIFQKHDVEAGWLDIEEDEELDHKSEVKVLLIPKKPSDDVYVESINILKNQPLYDINEIPIELIDQPPCKLRKIGENSDSDNIILAELSNFQNMVHQCDDEKLPNTVIIFDSFRMTLKKKIQNNNKISYKLI